MNKLNKYAFSKLYDISSGISSTKEQAGHGEPFASFSTVFNNIFLPDELPDFMDTSEKEQEIYSIKKGDILITRTSETVNELAMSCVALKDYPKATYSGFVKRLRPKTTGIAYDRFMAFFLRSKYFRKIIDCNTIMTLRASFNEDMFSFLEVYLPDYEIQLKVGNFLYDIERKIQNNKHINDNLQKQIKMIYDYWFLQFDFPNSEGHPYKSSGGAMEYSDRLKRHIPLDWKVESIINNSISTPIKPGVEMFEKKTYLATADVNGTTISLGSIISYENRESRANMQPVVSSIWFAKMKNSIKHLYLNKEMQPIIDSTILSTGFCGLQCSEQNFEYLASFVEHSYFETLKNILAHGATQESVNYDDLLGLLMIVPKEEVLEHFHRRTAPMYAQISKNICENQQLTIIRDWLLPMLMNGQANIGD